MTPYQLVLCNTVTKSITTYYCISTSRTSLVLNRLLPATTYRRLGYLLNQQRLGAFCKMKQESH